jgi:hypothetical protein
VVGCGQLLPDDRGRGEVAICAAVLGGRGAVGVREAGAGDEATVLVAAINEWL